MEGKRLRSSSQSSDFLTNIRELTLSILKNLCSGQLPVLVIDRFRNYCSDASGNCCCSYDLPIGKEILTLQTESQARRLDVLLRVLLIIQQFLQENRHGSKRDIYYMHPSVFKEQAIVDQAINDICILLQCSRHNLHVVSVGNGLVMGWLRLTEAGRKFDCINNPNTAYSVPVHVEDVQIDLISVAQYILVVEKESVFQRLANDQFCRKNRCIVITGRGYPDVPTRRFLRLLVEKLHLPAYCLVDSDPYGIDILTTYRFGSMQMAYDAEALRVPEIRWLGVFPSEIAKYCLPQHCLLPMTGEDKTRIKAMLLRCYLQQSPQLRLQMELLLQRGFKCEIEALSIPMEPRHAEASCILSLNMECEACKMKVMEVLGSIIGVYSVDIDAKQGRIKIFGEVEPNILLKAIAGTGRHAKLVWARINDPLVNRSYHGDRYSSYNHGYGSGLLEDPYAYGRALPSSSFYDTQHDDQYYPMRRRMAPDNYPYYSDYAPAARHVPSYPPPIYDPYQDESISLCNIM